MGAPAATCVYVYVLTREARELLRCATSEGQLILRQRQLANSSCFSSMQRKRHSQEMKQVIQLAVLCSVEA